MNASEIHEKLKHIPSDDNFNLVDIQVAEKIAKGMPEGFTVLNLGTYCGRSAATWKLLGASDVWTVDVYDWGFDEFKNDPVFKEGVHPIIGMSQMIPWDREVDIVFIDDHHEYQPVMDNLVKYFPYAKRVICGHDYGHFIFPGVVQAVDEFFKPKGLAVEQIPPGGHKFQDSRGWPSISAWFSVKK